jgi:peptidoglycan/xylan/chitin deacetylase (PgdA/CDA1 family)
MAKGNQAAAILETSRLGALLRRVGAWRGVLVLNHHRIGEASTWSTGAEVWSATAEEFDEQVVFLSRNFEVIDVDELSPRLLRQRGRRVAITFDDGYRECHDIAYPILKAHGVPATFFLVTGFLDGACGAWWDEVSWMVLRSERDELPANGWLPTPVALSGPGREAGLAALLARYKHFPAERAEDFLTYLGEATGTGRRDPDEARQDWMTWEMARELQRAGMRIAGHTVAHPVLARTSADRQKAEIAGSLDRIEAELGARPRIFSYPDGTRGSFDATTKALLRESGVRLGFANHGGIARADGWDPFSVPRISVTRRMTRSRFRAVATLPRQFHRR